MACCTASIKIVQFLLNAGASVEIKTSCHEEWAPLHVVANVGDEMVLQGRSASDRPKVVQLMLDKGANTETKKKNGKTPLMCALSCDQLDVAQILLDNKANMEAKDEDTGATPLIDRAYESSSETMQWLLDRGANVHAQDNNGDTAFFIL